MVIASIMAAVAAAGSIGSVMQASDATKALEVWRMIGFFTFSGLFGLLAIRPLAYKGIWELAILNKLALAIAGALFVTQGNIEGAQDMLIFDGMLTIMLIVAYVLVRKDLRIQSRKK